ncbi:MAG TPA: hypothetical protein VMD91_10820 [Candidatus Sulfotelmatobacter sp.]|nr:hypothetical protein [Candidatus Sulfotelmatobacter sp.]
MKRTLCAFTAALLAIFPAVQALPAGAASADITRFARQDHSDPLATSNIVLSSTNQSGVARVCFSFRNLTTKNVTSAKFHFGLRDQFGGERLSLDLIRNANGSFSSGELVRAPDPTAPGYSDTNNGSQSCWTFAASSTIFDGLNDQSHFTIDVTAMSYADGTTWVRGATFPRAFAFDGTPFVQQLKPFNATFLRVPELRAPIFVYSAALRSELDFTDNQKPKMQTCFSFRNLADRPAATIQFRFDYLDGNQRTVQIGNGNFLQWTRTGTFTPPTPIENFCMTFPLPDDRTIGAIQFFTIAPKLVQFADGTTWTPGTLFTKRYAADGSPYSGPQPTQSDVALVTNGPNPNPNPFGPTPFPQPTGNNSSGGFVNFNGGQPFGEIAWAQGSKTIYGTAVNKTSAQEAGASALAACYVAVQQANDGHRTSDCTLMVNNNGLNSAATRCAELIFDPTSGAYQVGYGPDQGAAYLDAGNRIRNLGASLQNTVIIVDNVCNVR